MTHHIYLIGEDIFLQNALNALNNMTDESETKSCKNNVLLGSQVIVFSMFAIEAVSNLILQKNIIFNEKKLRKLGLQKKLEILFKQMNEQIDWNSEHFQNFETMRFWRNNLAHFKNQRQKGLIGTRDFMSYVPSTEIITPQEDVLSIFSKRQCQKYYDSAIFIVTKLLKQITNFDSGHIERIHKNIFLPVTYG
jgi:hypothetical protein